MKLIADIRKEYSRETLNEIDVDPHPLAQFSKWWEQASLSDIEEINAMTLATVGTDGKPSARIVLLKAFNENGFTFFTNYRSRKATDIEHNSHVALVFFWKEIERQVRIEGIAARVSEEESDDYFTSRPVNSKIGAWSSPQSSVIASREILEKNTAQYEQQFSGAEIKRPDHWGGFVVKPDCFEFWQGRPGRLHDRIRYLLHENNIWKKERLAP